MRGWCLDGCVFWLFMFSFGRDGLVLGRYDVSCYCIILVAV